MPCCWLGWALLSYMSFLTAWLKLDIFVQAGALGMRELQVATCSRELDACSAATEQIVFLNHKVSRVFKGSQSSHNPKGYHQPHLVPEPTSQQVSNPISAVFFLSERVSRTDMRLAGR